MTTTFIFFERLQHYFFFDGQDYNII